MRRIWVLSAMLLITSTWLGAQDQPDRRIYIELEPLQFVNRGFSVVGHYALNDRLQIGTNVFASRPSSGSLALAFRASESIELSASQDLGINLSIRYFLRKQSSHKGWVISLPIGYETWTLTDGITDESVQYTFFYLGPRAGYLWHPFKGERFYILGEALLVVPVITDGAVGLGASTVEVNPIIPLPGVGLGFTF